MLQDVSGCFGMFRDISMSCRNVAGCFVTIGSAQNYENH